MARHDSTRAGRELDLVLESPQVQTVVVPQHHSLCPALQQSSTPAHKNQRATFMRTQSPTARCLSNVAASVYSASSTPEAVPLPRQAAATSSDADAVATAAQKSDVSARAPLPPTRTMTKPPRRAWRSPRRMTKRRWRGRRTARVVERAATPAATRAAACSWSWSRRSPSSRSTRATGCGRRGAARRTALAPRQQRRPSSCPSAARCARRGAGARQRRASRGEKRCPRAEAADARAARPPPIGTLCEPGPLRAQGRHRGNSSRQAQ
mmetsp:Transcript_42880/g.100490  ORF Transcript_42880/g.100490 Transcript_42880/m.100490 type:complete len:266 (-) Transcript_42880:1685-2482(-)